MTREDFLKNNWSQYPSLDPTYTEDNGWSFGKVIQPVSAGGDVVITCPERTHWRQNSLKPKVDAVLGPSIPAELLVTGDCVAIHRQTNTGPYLLSPRLSLEEINVATDERDWQEFLKSVALFFEGLGFIHWKTPYLVASSGVDAHIDFMTVKGVRTGHSYFLPTSPEFELKKAIARGEKKVFEIKSCFRDDDLSPVHRPEFTMIEWYRAYENKWQLFEDFIHLLKSVSAKFELAPFSVERVSISDLFHQHVGLDLAPTTTRLDLINVCKDKSLHYLDSDDWDDLFFRLFIEFIEPHLGMNGPMAVYNFPASQGSLSQKNQEGWADRFEIYWMGVELANAYQEQNNPQRVKEFVVSERDKRQKLGRAAPSIDENFLTQMSAGFPPCAGIAMGLDRLFMLLKRRRCI